MKPDTSINRNSANNGRPAAAQQRAAAPESSASASSARSSALHCAYRRGEFEVAFQPVFHGGGGRIIGAEALLRWTDGGGIPHSASDFVDRADEAELLAPLGRRALVEACRLARLWHLMGHREFRVSLNLSRSQLLHRELPAWIRDSLAESGLAAEALEFEFEGKVLADRDRQVGARLMELAGMGVRLIFDNFGVDVPELQRIAFLPLSGMKLHPSLTAGSLSTAKQRSCVTGLVELARLLDMDVGIKHVERATQALTLQQFKFSRMQGFLFGRALPASDFCDRFMWVSCPTELN